MEVQRSVETLIALSLSDPELLPLARELTQLHPRHSSHPGVAALQERSEHFVVDIIRRGQSVGAIRNDMSIDLLSRLVMANAKALDQWLTDKGLEEDEDVAKTMTDVLRRVSTTQEVATR